MGRSLSQLVADVQQGQQRFVDRQARLTESVNTALAGGLNGIGEIAEGLSQLRERQPLAVSPFLPIGLHLRLLLRFKLGWPTSRKRNSTQRSATSGSPMQSTRQSWVERGLLQASQVV
jgi:hypothetical protein